MKYKLSLLLVVLCAVAGVAAGCGDDDKSSSTKSTSSEQTTTGGDTSGDTSGGASDNPQIAAAVDSCKKSIDAVTQLSADTKQELNDLCEKAGSGDADDVVEASKQVCVKIAKETVPSGSAQDQAVSACDAISTK